MKNSLLLTLFVIFFSCHNDRTIPLLLDRVESLIETQPDSAEIFLDSIQMPDKLNDKLFARWCFLQSKTADKLHKEMPYVEHSHAPCNGTPNMGLQNNRHGLVYT